MGATEHSNARLHAGRAIRAAREAAGVSREDVAAALGVSVRTVLRVEAGTSGLLAEHVLPLALALDLTDAAARRLALEVCYLTATRPATATRRPTSRRAAA